MACLSKSARRTCAPLRASRIESRGQSWPLSLCSKANGGAKCSCRACTGAPPQSADKHCTGRLSCNIPPRRAYGSAEELSPGCHRPEISSKKTFRVCCMRCSEVFGSDGCCQKKAHLLPRSSSCRGARINLCCVRSARQTWGILG